MQPADVEDVGKTIATLMQKTAAEAITVECGGPRVYTYEELLRTIARAANVNRLLVPRVGRSALEHHGISRWGMG